MVATLILLFLMAMVVSITDQTGKIWKHSTTEIQAFQSARAAYSTMTQCLSESTLNTYLDYYNSSYAPRTPSNASTFVPAYYARNSALHFVVDQASTLVPGAANLHPGHAVFFQAPLGFTQDSTDYSGLPNMLNACGFYVEFNTDKPYLPGFLSSSTVVQQRYRYRLMQFLQPTEANTIYTAVYPGTAAQYDTWFTAPIAAANPPVRVLAENIIALAILPEISPQNQTGSATNLVSTSYTYDTRAGNISTTSTPNLPHHQLPPLLRVVMVAIDEPSALHLNPNGSTTPPSVVTGTPVFQNTTSNPTNPNTCINNDLTTLTSALSAAKINFRVFDSDIAIRGAKWSSQ